MKFTTLFSTTKKLIASLALLLSGYCVYAQPSYCSTGLGGTVGDVDIVHVTIPGTTLNNPSSGSFTYSVFPISGSTTGILQQGATYTVIVKDSLGTGNIAMWADFNQDGTFETYEWFTVGTSIAGIATATFTVPTTARTGVTGLRIRSKDVGEGSVLPGDACLDYFSGETQDYYVTIDTTLPCAGTPATGTITGPSSTCPGSSFTLSLGTYTISTGLTYQWLSHPVGSGSYTNIAGATNSDYTTAISASTDYELKITCTATGFSSTSATFTETVSSFSSCYCHDSTLLGGSPEFAPIDSVAIPGTTLNNYTPFNPDIYSSFPAAGSTTATLQQGATYSIVVNAADMFGDPANISMWIDYNHSGIFDPVEWTSVGIDITGTAVATFTVPLTAMTGLTGLRVRTISPFIDSALGAGDACVGPYTSGETEDYTITIDTTYPCMGTPVAGTISGPDSVCPVQVFTLSVTGYTIATGITFQWYAAPTGTSSFTAIPGATGIYCPISGQPASTDYKLTITCTGTGGTATSAIYTVNELPFTRCYCDSASLGGSAGSSQLDSVSIIGTALDNYTPFVTTTYASFPASGSTTATLHQGGYYTIVVGYTDFSMVPVSTSMWIDYNHNGIFEPVEWTLVGADLLGNAVAEFHVPVTAMTGLTGLRIRTNMPDFSGDSLGAGDACNPFEFGQTQDYLITIDTAFPCTGTPVAGIISGPDSICNSIAFNLSLSGYSSSVSGVTFQWQSRPSGTGSFTPIPGANTPYFTSTGIASATDYNVVVTCAGSGLTATSATFTVNISSFLTCYCSPATGVTLVSFDGEDEILTAKISGTTFDATGIIVPTATGYVHLPPVPASYTATFYIDSTYTFTITMDTLLFFTSMAAAWIDFDQNGLYDASEYIALTPGIFGRGTFTGTATIPASSLTGQTGMRIIAGDFSSPEILPCADIEEGEEVDFIVTIDTMSTAAVQSTMNTGFSVKVFPNPATKSITIKTYGVPGNNRNLILTDITGRIIEQVTMDTNQAIIDVENLEAGIYLVRYADDQHSDVIKITKQ